MERIPADIGKEMQRTLDRLAFIHKAKAGRQTIIHSHIHTTQFQQFTKQSSEVAPFSTAATVTLCLTLKVC